MERTYYAYVKIDSCTYMTCHNSTRAVELITFETFNTIPRKFEMFKYDSHGVVNKKTADCLLQFASDFAQWASELARAKKFKLDATYAYNTKFMVMNTLTITATGDRPIFYKKPGAPVVQWCSGAVPRFSIRQTI